MIIRSAPKTTRPYLSIQIFLSFPEYGYSQITTYPFLSPVLSRPDFNPYDAQKNQFPIRDLGESITSNVDVRPIFQ